MFSFKKYNNNSIKQEILGLLPWYENPFLIYLKMNNNFYFQKALEEKLNPEGFFKKTISYQNGGYYTATFSTTPFVNLEKKRVLYFDYERFNETIVIVKIQKDHAGAKSWEHYLKNNKNILSDKHSVRIIADS